MRGLPHCYRLVSSSIALAILLLLLPVACIAQAQGARELPGALLTTKAACDNHPCALTAKDGTVWVAWISNTGDHPEAIVIRSMKPGQKAWSASELVTAKRGEYFRPTLAQDAKGRIWTFWTANTGTRPAVLASFRQGGRWSKPMPVAANGPCQNQEVCTDSKGRIWMVYQTWRGQGYDIYMKDFDGAKWSPETPVARSHRNEWDPVVAADRKGNTWIAWSAYEDKRYALYMAPFKSGKLGQKVAVATDARYNIHPWLCVDNRDRVWITWDSVTLSFHGSSGITTITGANLHGINRTREPSGGSAESFIKLACYDGRKLYKPLTLKSKNSAAAEPYTHSHAGLPKVSVDDKGNVYVTHRARVKPLKPKTYFWDVLVERYSGGKWLQTLRLAHGDGAQEEASVTPLGKRGFLVAYETEYRKDLPEAHSPDEPGVSPENRVNILDSNGDVFTAVVPLVSATTDFATAMAPAQVAVSTYADSRRSRTANSIELRGKKYDLYWGDLHKHSNVSRCSGGVEPAPEDHYIYSHDVCNYDFMGMTDHAEHTSLHNWWRLEKLADLYYVPGSFVPFPGYEWTPSFPSGHRNVFFPGRPATFLRSTMAGSHTPKQLWAALKGKKALTIPHTTASKVMGLNWKDYSPEYQRAIEIFQASRGSFESEGCPREWKDVGDRVGYVQQGLAKDYRSGIICSSDHGTGVSYAVVYADKLDRKSVFDALYSRRCYGSTAYGTVLEFWADGHFMGEEYKSATAPKIDMFVSAPVNIRSVEVIKDGKVVFSKGSVEKPINSNEVKLSWADRVNPSPWSYYYLRVIRVDDEMAWSSPIWVDKQEQL